MAEATATTPARTPRDPFSIRPRPVVRSEHLYGELTEQALRCGYIQTFSVGLEADTLRLWCESPSAGVYAVNAPGKETVYSRGLSKMRRLFHAEAVRMVRESGAK